MQKTKQNFCMAKLLILDTHSKISKSQGWEFAHRFSKRITRFLPKNKWMTDLLKKTSDLLIPSFLVSNLSDSLISLIKKEGMSKSLIF